MTTALLTLWCHGKLPGTTIRWLTECATLLAAIAKCGSNGVQPCNVHRDLTVNFCKGIDLPTGFPVAVPCEHPKTLKKDVETSQVFLPHVMLSKLATSSSFNKLFPLDCLESFWAQAEKTGDDRLINHPLKKGKGKVLEEVLYTTLCPWGWCRVSIQRHNHGLQLGVTPEPEEFIVQSHVHLLHFLLTREGMQEAATHVEP